MVMRRAVLVETAIEIKARNAAEQLKRLADPTRMAIILILAEQDRNGTELQAELSCRPHTTAHHLALLYASGLIESRRQGNFRIYQITGLGRVLVKSVETFLAAMNSQS
jgi:predicted transcriptional regulator